MSHPPPPAPRRLRVAALAAVVVGVAAGCGGPASETPPPSPAAAPPALLVGRFEDDYGGRYRIDASAWHAGTARYEIVVWDPAARWALARNAPSNASDPGLWSRFDWVELEGAGGWGWGYCHATWNAPTREAARAAPRSDRNAPRTGCAGHPFSRMRRLPDDDAGP